MRTRSTWSGAAALAAGALFLGAACSSGNSGGGSTSPLTLISECDRICGQLATCGVANAGLESQCMGACGDLTLVPASCLDPFAGYITCLAGVTSVQCGPGGDSVFVSPPSCEADRQAFLNCNAGPSPVSACIGLPGNAACAGVAGAPAMAAFCVGQPAQCTSPQPNPLGLGTFCCPGTN